MPTHSAPKINQNFKYERFNDSSGIILLSMERVPIFSTSFFLRMFRKIYSASNSGKAANSHKYSGFPNLNISFAHL